MASQQVGAGESAVYADGVEQPSAREQASVVKVRETTKLRTFTIPHSEDQKLEFFHGKDGSTDPQWTQLHVVDQVTKVLLRVYSREEAIVKTSFSTKRGKSKSGVIVTIIPI